MAMTPRYHFLTLPGITFVRLMEGGCTFEINEGDGLLVVVLGPDPDPDAELMARKFRDERGVPLARLSRQNATYLVNGFGQEVIDSSGNRYLITVEDVERLQEWLGNDEE